MKQPAQTNKQTGKRIVSKGEYAHKQMERMFYKLFGIGVLLGIIFCAFVTLVFGIMFFLMAVPLRFGPVEVSWSERLAQTATSLLWTVIAGFGTYALCMMRAGLLKDAALIDPGIPLTRANTADLPAPDSLVRASEEPKQEQQAVLLRAATETQEKHEEQLVRAVKE